MKKSVAIIGSRDFKDYEKLKITIPFIIPIKDIEKIVSGGARGADKLAELFAKENKIPIEIYKAEWENYGKSAGMIRNKEIINNCDMVIAFWDGESKGTKNSLKYAKKMEKKIKIIKV